DPGSEREPCRPQLRVWIARCHDVQCGAEVLEFAGTFVPGAFAAADTAKVEAQHGASDLRQRLCRPEHGLRVHRPALDGEWMAEDHGCAERLARRQHRWLGQGLEASGRPIDLAHPVVRHQPTILALRSVSGSSWRATNPWTTRANSPGRVTVPMWPVRGSQARSAPGIRFR